MPDHAAHFLLLLLPLAAFALFQIRHALPIAAMLLVLHHHLDPLPGSVSPMPQPLCCTLAQSTEPAGTEAPSRAVFVLDVPAVGPVPASQGFRPAPPAIRAPPAADDLPPPAS